MDAARPARQRGDAPEARGPTAPLRFSVVVPARDAAHLLPDTLGALAASALPRQFWELIVVDDASRDATPDVAGRFAVRVVRLTGVPAGPGAARNAGVAEARGAWLVFIDADVRVHPDTLDRFHRAIDSRPHLVAVFGAYDDQPEAPGLVSQFRNLLHRYVHLRGAGDAATFWAGCGAVRRDAFTAIGGFDTKRFPSPQVEDIELGYRLRELGGRIVLDPTIEGTHLKRWTFGAMVGTDIRDRGIPWTRLLLERRGRMSPSLNTTGFEQVKVGLTAAALVLLPFGAMLGERRLAWAGGAALAVVTVANWPVHHWFASLRGPLFAVATVPLLLGYYAGSAMAGAIGVLLHFWQGLTWNRPGSR